MTVPALSLRRVAPWRVLARHEWRLTVRDVGRTLGGATGQKRRLAVSVVGVVLLHVFGLIALAAPKQWRVTPESRIVAVAAMAFLFTLMLSAAMSRIVAAFHERRDLDLLLGAPIAPDLLLAVRAATVVVAVSALAAVFVFPLADVGVATGRWWMARLYPIVPLFALLATAIALLATGALVRLVGVRRARVGLQVFSALVGASFYLVSQARQLLPDGFAARIARWFADTPPDGPLGMAIGVPSRLVAGDVGVWGAFVVVCVALFAASVRVVRSRFLDVARTAEADAPVRASPRAAVDRRIASGFAHDAFAALLFKEWRLLVRAPQLISQILLQLLYLMPLLFVAFGHDHATAGWNTAAFAAGIVGVAGTLASSLGWLTVSAEDAPDLIAGSPRGRNAILLAKLTAGAFPPIAIVVVAAIGTVRRSLVDAAIVLVLGVLSCVAAAILATATSRPGKRNDYQRRHRGGGVAVVIEGLQFLLWAGAAGIAVSGYWIPAIVAVVAALALAGFHVPRALRRFDDAAR